MTQRSEPSDRPRRTPRGWTWRDPYFVAAVGIVSAIVVFGAIVITLPAADRSALLVDLARTAIGIVPIAFFSVIVAELVRNRDAAKGQRELEQQARRDFLSRTVAAYNGSKSTRHRLRGAGLRPDSDIKLSGDDLRSLDDLIAGLIETQLAFEQLKRESLFSPARFASARTLKDHLEAIEKYLNRVVKDWELGRPAPRPGVSSAALGQWTYYQDFVAQKNAQRLDDDPTAAFKALATLIASELGSARPDLVEEPKRAADA